MPAPTNSFAMPHGVVWELPNQVHPNDATKTCSYYVLVPAGHVAADWNAAVALIGQGKAMGFYGNHQPGPTGVGIGSFAGFNNGPPPPTLAPAPAP